MQIVALERSTTGLIWNKTFGICDKGPGWYVCAPDEKTGVPEPFPLTETLDKLGPEALIIGASHAGGAGAMEWIKPDEGLFVTNNLAGIGFPKQDDKEIGAVLKNARAGEFAGVGVPKQQAGEANLAIGTTAGLDGYLTPDSNVPPHYHFVSPTRVPFDTRFEHRCGDEECIIAQTVGTKKFETSMKKNTGGYLVTGVNRLTLAPIESKTFVTGVGEAKEAAGQQAQDAMQGFLTKLVGEDAIVLVTSVHGPAQNPKVFYTKGTRSWDGLLKAVVAAGGTRERFVEGAVVPGDDYTLVGGSHLAEGEGQETGGRNGRLRGAFVPDSDSVYQPRSTSSAAAPSEKLMDLVMQSPGQEAWPDEDDPTVMAAISAIGVKTKLLGRRPRFAYWNSLTTAARAGQALREVKDLRRSSLPGLSDPAFEAAKGDLVTELNLVESARAYMEELAQPEGAGGGAYMRAATVSDELEEDLKKLKEEGEAFSEYFAVLQQLFETGALIASGGESEAAKFLVKFLQGMTIAAETGQTAFNTSWKGAQTTPSVAVKAAQLGETLVQQARDNEKAFTRFGDIIVSDWHKLQIVGEYGGCNPEGSCGEHDEWDQLALTPAMATQAETATIRAFNREIYTRLVPLAFPIWHTGRIQPRMREHLPPGRSYECSDFSHPFLEAPKLSYFPSPAEFNPTTGVEEWEMYLSVARSGLTYGFAKEPMLERMFDPMPVGSSDPFRGGLGMNPGDFMREGMRISEYVPSHNCTWD
jgi:hypothetical protein